MREKVLVVAAHPDDEVLGMGGTLLGLKSLGKTKTYILFLSAGEMSRGKQVAKEKLRLKQAIRVAGLVGAKVFLNENFPDNAFDSVPLLKITKTIERYIRKIKPRTIFTHHHGDLNIDHRLTFQAVMTACRPGKTSVKNIYSFEILSSTEWQVKRSSNIFLPNTYIDIDKFLKQKIKLLKIYSREVNRFPFPRSATGINVLAMYRGMECGLKYAEAFQLIRSIR